MTAPIILFAYKRADTFQRTIAALQANHLAAQSDLHIFVDGPRTAVDQPKVAAVQALARQVTGFRSLTLHFSEANCGCAQSIINGVSLILRDHLTAIIVEDDIVTAPNFLDFINQGLVTYRDSPRVFSVGGYTFPFRKPADYQDDVYFFGRTCAWGWGIWADRWFKADWNVMDFPQFMADSGARRAFNYYGSDRVRMLRRTIQGDIDTWDIRLCYALYKQQGLTVYPTVSKTTNIGFGGGDGMHANVYDRYKTTLDTGEQRQFRMPGQAFESPYYTQQVRHQFSLTIRLYNRLKTMAGVR
ncbi:hypothetical protein FAES_0808 [Fibrella aestuarina BUZ 2]|uniref:Glycosyltransferase n=1 Tax=Fibrella aestuarina BUZ 2 TaxID=1166018 RepID=I0K3W6_9BACT|nr:hypothetical protein [Fibrella aestuarina]CCG98819.1 hypothetical protein FAES_0808 [Fibrella aestuarina BUZ 2]